MSIDVVQTIFIAITLICVVIYTIATHALAKETREMARATVSMAQNQREEIELRKHPVISVHLDKASAFTLPIVIMNSSMVYARVRIEVDIRINGQDLELPPEDPYAGKKISQVQAGSKFHGKLDLEKYFAFSHIEKPQQKDLREGIISLRLWAINFYEKDERLSNDINRIPIIRWNWNIKGVLGIGYYNS